MKKRIMILLFFVVSPLVLTYPLIIKITTHIPGFFSTDEPYMALWDSWRIKYTMLHHLSFWNFSFVSYPFGVDIFSSVILSYIWLAWHHLLSMLTTPILTYNLQVLVNFLLIQFCMYLLVSRITKNRLSALLSSTILAFCPYQFIRSWQHLTATYNECLPLVFLSVFLMVKSTWKRRIIFFVSLLFLFSFDYYLAYFSCISMAAFLLYILIYNWRLKLKRAGRALIKRDLGYIKAIIAVIIVFIIVYMIPVHYPLIKSLLMPSSREASAYNPLQRPFDDLFSQSARPLSFFLPAAVHPIFGKFTEQFVGTFLYGASYTEHTLYLGWIPLILAFVAFRRWRKGRKLRDNFQKDGTIPFDDNFYIGFFVFLAIVAWLFSQPPWWNLFGFKLYMPSFFLYKIVPMFRAYCRFGIVLMFAVAVLAGFGLKYILERISNKGAKISIAVLCFSLVFFEFWNYPPYKVIDVSRFPAVYDWLRSEPEDIVIAEYPLDALDPDGFYKLYQTRHEHKMINSSARWTRANNIALGITQLSAKKSAGILKWLGVKYVIVHHDGYLNTELIKLKEELARIPYNPDLKLVKSFPAQECPQEGIICTQKTGPIDVYEVLAEPQKPKE